MQIMLIKKKPSNYVLKYNLKQNYHRVIGFNTAFVPICRQTGIRNTGQLKCCFIYFYRNTSFYHQYNRV